MAPRSAPRLGRPLIRTIVGRAFRYCKRVLESPARFTHGTPPRTLARLMRITHDALTFDDVLLQPAYSEILPREVSLKTRVARDITLNIPILSAAMDSVTEARLAITMAQEGGLGIIHKNMSPADQARQVAQVGKYESGIVNDPITVRPDQTIREVLDITHAHNISGVPVVDKGRTVGIVTNRDLRFETRLDAPVSSVMTPESRLITVREGADKKEVLGLLHKGFECCRQPRTPTHKCNLLFHGKCRVLHRPVENAGL